MKIEYRNKQLPINEQIYLLTDYRGGMKIKAIMEKYNVSKTTIYNILKRQVNADNYTLAALQETVKGITK